MIEELGETLRAVIGAQKTERLAEIAGEQALKLKELELRTSEPEEKIMAFGSPVRGSGQYALETSFMSCSSAEDCRNTFDRITGQNLLPTLSGNGWTASM